jgi:hypothetical protein
MLSGPTMRLCATDYRATYWVVQPFRLPYHCGSLLRGVLGRALRLAGCAGKATSYGLGRIRVEPRERRR